MHWLGPFYLMGTGEAHRGADYVQQAGLLKTVSLAHRWHLVEDAPTQAKGLSVPGFISV